VHSDDDQALWGLERLQQIFADHWDGFKQVNPRYQTCYYDSLVKKWYHTLRQRISRLVRSTLAFSKKLANHMGAIRYFICHYNLTKAAALLV
jgi:hypothetical protein